MGEMLLAAASPAEGIDVVRGHLYNAKEQIYFGELTVTPRAGVFRFNPKSWDDILGTKWRLNA
jgi:hypothetical protein